MCFRLHFNHFLRFTRIFHRFTVNLIIAACSSRRHLPASLFNSLENIVFAWFRALIIRYLNCVSSCSSCNYSSSIFSLSVSYTGIRLWIATLWGHGRHIPHLMSIHVIPSFGIDNLSHNFSAILNFGVFAPISSTLEVWCNALVAKAWFTSDSDFRSFVVIPWLSIFVNSTV